MMFPEEFISALRESLGEGEAERLLAALDGEPTVSVRYNPFKLSAMPAGDGVPWNRYGAYLAERPVFTLDPAMHSGAYYVQEASSQFVEHILREAVGYDHPGTSCHPSTGGEPANAQLLGNINSRQQLAGFPSCGGVADANASDGVVCKELPDGLRILDLCAAPGGKTTLYSTLAGPGGLVVANEPIKQRANILADNVRRWGIGNVAVSCNEAGAFAPYRHFFDVLAIDAPCSGEGMFRKNRQARDEWSASNVELCAARQRRIVAEAWETLRPGGILIYSTCTFNRRENEDNVAWIANNFAIEPVEVDIPANWGIETSINNYELIIKNSPDTTDTNGIQTFRFYPHLVRGEGFFAAVMRKSDGKLKHAIPKAKKEPLTELNRNENRPLAEWVAGPEAIKFARAGENCYAFYRPQYGAIAALAGGLNIIYSGVCMGQTFNGRLRPDHALALFHDLRPAAATVTELPKDRALDYLRKREFEDVETLAEGLNLLTHNGLPIGWTKRIGHRTNTMLPNSFRIVNL
jgi:16S rRNA C967 or C1407 C5-methylase (RsmB/RsmF family)/NOL1/NOP2/fmu family ribosome biogenesis protein